MVLRSEQMPLFIGKWPGKLREVEGGWEVTRRLGGYSAIGPQGPKGTRPMPCHSRPNGATLGHYGATTELP